MHELVNRKATLNAAALELAAHLKTATAAADRLAGLLAQANLVESMQPRAPAPPTRDQGGDRLWTVKDVTTFLSASRSWVYEHSAAGLLPCVRVGGMLRFEPDRVRAYAREQRSRS